MGYLLKSEVMRAIKEDKQTSLMCCNNKAAKEIVNFCYESIEREIDSLPECQLDNAPETNKGLSRLLEKFNRRL